MTETVYTYVNFSSLLRKLWINKKFDLTLNFYIQRTYHSNSFCAWSRKFNNELRVYDFIQNFRDEFVKHWSNCE